MVMYLIVFFLIFLLSCPLLFVISTSLPTKASKEKVSKGLDEIESFFPSDLPNDINQIRKSMMALIKDEIVFSPSQEKISSLIEYETFSEETKVVLEKGKHLMWISFFIGGEKHELEIDKGSEVRSFTTKMHIRDFFNQQENKELLDTFLKKVLRTNWYTAKAHTKNQHTISFSPAIQKKLTALKTIVKELQSNNELLDIKDVHQLEVITKEDLVHLLTGYQKMNDETKISYEKEILSVLDDVIAKAEEIKEKMEKTKQCEVDRSIYILKERLK